MDTTKELERQVIADRKVEEQRQIAEEVQKRQALLEAERVHREWQEEKARTQLRRPMDRQAIFSVPSSRIRGIMSQPFPVEYISLPEEVAETLEEIFGKVDLLGFSQVVTAVLHCLSTVEGENRKAAREKGAHYLAGRKGPVVGVPIWREKTGAYSVEMCTELVCGWSLAYLERKEAQETLLKERQ